MSEQQIPLGAPIIESPSAHEWHGRGRRRLKQGRVASNKMQKTIVVVTERRVPHPVYHKIVRKSVRFKAHDEKNEAGIGDLVLIMETRPLSAEKCWRLVRILERAK
jgi:small subunit ribosomal protein S17